VRDLSLHLLDVMENSLRAKATVISVTIAADAPGLGKPYSEVAGVVGFYSFFSTVPRGKRLVRVCLGTAC
jgi:NADH:ubiquinone oxidoreductase subunit E